MNDDDKKAFVLMLEKVSKLYRKQEISVQSYGIYFDTLKAWSINDIRSAFNAHIQDPDKGQYVPKPADILRYLRGGSETQALRAWTDVERAIRTVGSYSSIVFDDVITMRVIDDMGGWIQLAGMDSQASPFKAREFQTRYQGFSLRPPDQYPGHLIGITELDSRSTGELTMIGDHTKCLEICRSGQLAAPKLTRLSSANALETLKALAAPDER